jgi:hypothetical protein
MAASGDTTILASSAAQVTGSVGMYYADLYPALEFDFPLQPDHEISGQTAVSLGTLGPGASVQSARVRVAGAAFHGKLNRFFGTRVTRSPLLYDTDGAAAPSVPGQSAYVIDFGGVRSVLGLRMPAGVKIVLVLPWMGTDFGQKPIYPISSTFSYIALPRADATGKAQVGFPAIESAKLFVQIAGSGIADEAAFAENVRIVSAVLPSNLRASVAGRPVFCTHPGTLEGEIELDGLVAELNAVAQGLGAPQVIKIDIVSDTPGALSVLYEAATDLEIERSQDALWGGRATLDLPLPALMPTPLDLLLPTTDAATWQVRRIALEFSGSFPRWRAFGPAGPPQGRLSAAVNARFSVARRLVLPGRVVLHGVALALQASGGTELRLEIAADADGTPLDGPALATLDLAPDSAGAEAAWHDALLATPIDSGDAQALWVVLKGKSGGAAWLAQGEAAALPRATLYTRDGGRWQRYPTRAGQVPAPQLRVLREPLPRENASLLTLAWNGTPLSADAEPGTGAPGRVEFVLPGDETRSAVPAGGAVTLGLTATAGASGMLTLRRATAYHR